MTRTTLAAVLLVLVPLVGSAAPSGGGRGLDVYWIDTEGGGATLIVTPAGESVLIDAGNPGGRDAGRIHEVATKVAGLKGIDHLVVTHLHRDHFGGVAELADLMPVGTLWSNPIESAPEAERAQPELAAYRAAKVVRWAEVIPGDSLLLRQTLGAAFLSVRFLAAREVFADAPRARANDRNCASLVEKPADPSDNRNSVVTLVEMGDFRFFDGGDLTWNTEGRLVCPQDRVGRVDVYQSDHHGLDVSNNPVLVRTLSPTVVVFNNGPRKGGERGSIGTAKEAPSVRAVYQVHRNVNEGALNTTDALIANRDVECSGNFIHLSVEPQGHKYRVSVPATKHQAEYATKASPGR